MELVLSFGEGGEGVDGEEEGAGFGVIHVEDFHVHFQIGVEVAAEVTVDELETAIGQFVGEQAAREADLLVDGLEGGFLGVGVEAEVPFVRHQVAGADFTVGFDAVAGGVRGVGGRLFGGGWGLGIVGVHWGVSPGEF